MRLKIIPVILMGVGLAVLIYWFAGLLRAQPETPRRVPAVVRAPVGGFAPDIAALERQVTHLSNQVDSLTKSKDDLKKQLDSVSDQASHAQWLLSVILGTVGLLALVQGLFAFFSAQNYTAQAENAIKRANEAVAEAENKGDEAVAKVQAKFPMFADIEFARAEAFGDLGKLMPALVDTDKNVYAKSDPLTRQKMFAIESFSAIQFLSPVNRGKQLVGRLRLLGRFYAGKFSSDGQHLHTDFDRAYYYFDLAAQMSNRGFPALNDLGWLWSFVAIPPQPDKGRACFEESLRAVPKQQRALYNLGTMAFEKGKKARLEEARDYLLKAKEHPNWETTPNPAMASHVDYNLACVCDALVNFETDPAVKSSLLDECARWLEQAAAVGAQPRELLDGDLKPGDKEKEDLINLGASQAHAGILRGILDKYEAAWRTNAS